MATVTRPNLDDPLDLVTSLQCRPDQILALIKDASAQRRVAESDVAEAKSGSKLAAAARDRAGLWSEVVDRLFEQYRLMTHG